MNFLTQLIQILNNEKELYVELTELAEAKQKTIISNDVEKLAECLKKEDQLIQEIEGAEKERRKAIIGLCTQLNISEQDLSFTKLREFINEESRQYLDRLKQNLLGVLDHLHQVNENNKMLIEQSLNVNQHTLNLLTQARSSQPTYTKEGSDQQTSGGNRRLIDKKV